MARAQDRDDQESEVWPAHVRYPVIVVLVGLGLIGLVTVLYDAGWLPLAGPFVAVVVAGTIVYVLMWWRSRKLRRLAASAVRQLEALGPQLEAERRLPVAQRPTAASDQSLDQATQQVESALQRLAWADEPGATPYLAELAARARSSWRPEAPLTQQVERLERTSAEMQELVRRMLAAAERRRR